jgi:hypothetical protein
MIRIRARFVAVVIAGCVAAAPTIVPAVSRAVELGLDAGASVQWPDSVGRSNLAFAVPGSEGGTGTILQTFRVGLALSERSQIELAPGVAVASENDALRGRYTIGQYTMALSYLRGRIRGDGARPYLRVGGLASLRTVKDAYGYTSRPQGGVSVGAGFRWAWGNVFGIRTEIRVARLFSTARWPPGSGSGIGEGWEIGLHGGASVFTK